jgi:membrane protein YdbS with pleckstrin-like domain
MNMNRIRRVMSIEQVLRWIVIAIVMMVAVVLLSVMLQTAGFLLRFALKVLVVLFVVAVVLRLFEAVSRRRR